MTRAARIIAAFPVFTGATGVRVTELAARHGGSNGAHALDAGHRLSALVLRAAAKIVGAPYPRNAAERRALWMAVGVASDGVSATVLVANFRPAGTELVARQLRERADAGLPAHLCALDLASGPLLPDWAGDIYVCDNPSVLEAALAAGVTSTLVCTQGNATNTTLSLLSALAMGGNRLFYRGDFDWPGLVMANHVMSRTGARPWRFDHETYRAAVERYGIDDLVPLQGKPVEASWDRDLARRMADIGVAVHEELLVEDLVAGLLENKSEK